MRKMDFRNGQEGGIALVWLPILLAAGTVVYSVVLMHNVHNLQYQTDQLQHKLSATASASPLLSSSLPEGSVSFKQLSPDLQAQLTTINTPADSSHTSATSKASARVSSLGNNSTANIQGGIASLNGLTAANQTIALDRSGTSVGVQASGSTITLSLPMASADNEGLLSAADYTAFSTKQSALAFGDGLTSANNTVTNTLTTGLSGGQTVAGGTAAGDDLMLTSTTNASKGKLLFGTSAYDEATNRLGIGTALPSYALDIETTSASGLLFNVASTSPSLTGSGLASIDWSPSSAATSSGDLLSINAGNNAAISSLLRVRSHGTNVFTVGQNNITFGKPVSFSASASYPVNIVFDNYTVTSADNVILAEAVNNNMTITLPDPTSATGREYTIKRLDAPTYTLSIVSAGGATVEQQNSISLAHQGDSVQLVSDGSRWQIIGQWASSYTYTAPIPYPHSVDTDSQGN